MTSYGGNTDDAIAKTTTAKEEAYEENTISLCTQSLPAAPPAPGTGAARCRRPRADALCLRGSTLCAVCHSTDRTSDFPVRSARSLPLTAAPLRSGLLRISNFLIALAGIGVLALYGLMLKNDEGIPAMNAMLLIVGLTLAGLGVFGIIATWKRFLAKLYFITLFFTFVFAVWVFLYAALNFPKIEDSVKHRFEEHWDTLVVEFSDDWLARIPESCGGTLDNTVCDDLPLTEAGCVAPDDAPEGVMCVFYPAETFGEACYGWRDPNEDGADNWPTSGDCYAETEGSATMEADCQGADLDDWLTCDYYPAETFNATCTEEVNMALYDMDDTEEDDAAAGRRAARRRMQEGEAGYEAECWATIKDLAMDNIKSVRIVLIVNVALMVLNLFWTARLLTFETAIGAVRKVIDLGMTAVGAVLLLAGAAIGALTDPNETMAIMAPCIILGLMMVVLGFIFGCCGNMDCMAKLRKYAFFMYMLLLVLMVIFAYVGLAQEDEIKEKIEASNGTLIDKFCDLDCQQEMIDARMAARGGNQTCPEPASGTGPCQAEYEWTLPRETDSACDRSVRRQGALARGCECPCGVAERIAEVKVAMEASIIAAVQEKINYLAWVCILICFCKTTSIEISG
eukprot:COSAG04_NODE_187_length_21001_cov_8.855277_9_plen_625_part_00